LVKRILTKIAVARKPSKKKGIVYRSPRIYLSTKLTDDSMFPFFGGQQVEVKIVGRQLVISGVRSRSGSRCKRVGKKTRRGTRR